MSSLQKELIVWERFRKYSKNFSSLVDVSHSLVEYIDPTNLKVSHWGNTVSTFQPSYTNLDTC